jgi:hypothetical protein
MFEEEDITISLDNESRLEKILIKIKSISKVIIFSFIEKFYFI